MHRVQVAVGVCCALVAVMFFYGNVRASGASPAVAGVWTLIIPEAFEGAVFSWHLKSDGTYAEDGWDRDTGAPIQETLSGRWAANGDQLTLTQDTLGYVFKGTLAGNSYYGQLYLRGERVSTFCALKGEAPPAKCDPSIALRDRGTPDG